MENDANLCLYLNKMNLMDKFVIDKSYRPGDILRIIITSSKFIEKGEKEGGIKIEICILT